MAFSFCQVKLNETKLNKIKENGVLSTSFGNAGEIQIDNYAGGVSEQVNGRLLFQGSVNDWEGGTSFTMSRFYIDGNLDNSFNFQPNYNELGSYIPLYHSNGKIYVLGSDIWYNAPPMNFVMLRYNNNPLGVEEENVQNFSVSPNPSMDVFNVTQSSYLSFSEPYFVYDLKGALLMQGIFQKQSAKVDLSLFEDGIYLLKVNNSILKLVKK